jgi:hypothetical protein
MFFTSWLRKKTPRPRSAARCRPQLEALGDRVVPSTLHVTNTFDSGPGSLRDETAQAKSSDTIVKRAPRTRQNWIHRALPI